MNCLSALLFAARLAFILCKTLFPLLLCAEDIRAACSNFSCSLSDTPTDSSLRFKVIGEAYEVLTDPTKKELYEKGSDGIRSDGSLSLSINIHSIIQYIYNYI